MHTTTNAEQKRYREFSMPWPNLEKFCQLRKLAVSFHHGPFDTGYQKSKSRNLSFTSVDKVGIVWTMSVQESKPETFLSENPVFSAPVRSHVTIIFCSRQ